jgi:diguanylate cyclase (GGDEF)-like protein/excisionase family DNA binding protein
VPHQVRDRASEQEPLLSVAQAALLLGVHPNTLRAWTEAGRVPAYRINARGDRRYRRTDLDRLLVEGAAPETAATRGQSPLREAEMAVLARLASGGTAAATPASVARITVEALRTQIGIARVALYLARDPRDAVLHLETHAGYRLSPPATRSAGDVDQPAPPAGDTVLDLALRSGGEVQGLLVLEDENGGTLRSLSASFLRTVAATVAADLLSARILSRARRELTRARALRHVTQELTGQLDLTAVLNDVVDRTRSLFDADKAGLWLLDESEHPFRSAATRGLGEQFEAQVRTLQMTSKAVGVRAVRERRTLVIHDAWRNGTLGTMRSAYRAEAIRTACLVPLISNDRAVGVIGLYHTTDHAWPEEELALAQSFANQAAVAIANARLYRSVADQAARIRSIQDLSARLNRLTDVQAIADAIVAEASTLAAYHDIRVYAVDWERGVCEPISYTDRLLGEGDFREALRVDIGEGSFTGWVAEHGEAILSNDALNDPRGHTIEGTDDIEESMLLVPMVFEGRAVGVIALSKLGSNQFSQDDLQTMTIFAGYAAQAMANAGAYERLELQSAELARQLQSQRRLLEINERLLSTLEQGDVMESIADGLRSVVAYDNLSIYRADHVHRILVPVLTRERHAAEVARYIVPFGRGLMGWAVEHCEPILANDALGDPRAMQIPGTPADPEAIVVVPLLAEGEAIGCLNISRVGSAEAQFSEADFELVKLFAGQASIAMRNAEAHQAVTTRADTDALTGLGNHGAFQRTLSEMLARAATHGPGAAPQTVALLMMDLDRFKTYNDRLGHPAGDALLHAVGTAIYGAARSDDRVFRYGGDEFALILPGVNPKAASAVAERVRAAVANLTSREPNPVTITVGLAAFPEDATDKNDLIAAADTALYYGKQAGEDRLVRVDEVPREMRDLRGTLDRLTRAALAHPEDTSTVDHLVEEAARLSGGAAAVSGERQEDTVRDTLLGVARSLDALDAATIGHGDRVGRLARRIADRLGCDEEEAATIELAARLHGLEIVGASELDSIRSLHGVADIVRAHRDGLTGTEAPLGAQVVAVANAYDTLTTAVDGVRGRRQALEELQGAGAHRYRADVVEALAAVVAVKPRSTARRRRSEVARRVRGAA